MPQAWSPPKSPEKAERSGVSAENKDASEPPSFRFNQSDTSEGQRPTDSKSAETGAAGGEMDWDTALDTILKTLKKDRGVGERT
jgi:hypothetical protein